MKFKKMIFVLSITTFVIFLGMFGTSYAYYVSSGGPNLNVSTPDFDPSVAVVFDQSEYINVKSGVPILASDVDIYASKSTFTLIPDANILNNGQVAVNISLVDVYIDNALKISDFKYKLVCNDGTSSRTLASGTGADVTSNTLDLGGMNTTDNNFDVNKEYACTFSVWLQESGSDQNNLMNKKFSGLLKVGTMFKGNKAPSESGAKTISNLFNPNDTVTSNGVTHQIDTTHQLIKDEAGNIRFYGKKPNNYVRISGTAGVWRIIGIFDNRIKLMQDWSLGKYLSWDSSENGVHSGYGINEWSQADLMKLLNPGFNNETVGGSLWFDSLNGNCYKAPNNSNDSCNFSSSNGLDSNMKKRIDTVSWNVGGGITNDTYPNLIYREERGTGVLSNPSDGVARSTIWKGKIGLPYPSDYGYATDLKLCSKTLINYNSSDNNYACRGNNWMWYTMTGATSETSDGSWSAWLLTPSTNNSYHAWRVANTGLVNYAMYTSNAYAIYPTFYLYSNQAFESGHTGSSSDPYILK